MTRVKICGLKDEVHALAAAEAGADFIGLVFAPSQRQVTPTQAERIATVVKATGQAVEVVGLVVNETAQTVNEMADFCRVDRVPLCGDERWEYCRAIKRPLIKFRRVSWGSCADRL